MKGIRNAHDDIDSARLPVEGCLDPVHITFPGIGSVAVASNYTRSHCPVSVTRRKRPQPRDQSGIGIGQGNDNFHCIRSEYSPDGLAGNHNFSHVHGCFLDQTIKGSRYPGSGQGNLSLGKFGLVTVKSGLSRAQLGFPQGERIRCGRRNLILLQV